MYFHLKCGISLTGLSESETIYKHLRPLQILKSEESINNLQDFIKNEDVNSFGIDIDTNKLINLSSCESVDDEITTNILDSVKTGELLAANSGKIT